MGPDEIDEIRIAPDVEAELVAMLDKVRLSRDEFADRLAKHADQGKPVLQPPIPAADIDTIEDERLRALAWDLHAIAAAYNFASDPTVPDLARDDVGTWVGPAVRDRLEVACALLMDAYDLLLDDVDEDLDDLHSLQE